MEGVEEGAVLRGAAGLRMSIISLENLARDILGRVYEYFFTQFASAEGKSGIGAEHLPLHLIGSNIALFVNGAIQPMLNQGNMNCIPFMLPPPESCRS